MNKIDLLELRLTNFKGIRHLCIEFKAEEENLVVGKNGSGKTTLFDAFTWLLFGKDSRDRKDFAIKTYDKDGNTIPNLPHEVSATISVNGETIELRKSYKEIWARDRATQVEYIRSHQTDCFYNNVPLSVSEYADKINEILSEETFKLITNPFYFTSQKQDVQRKFLFSLAGEINDSEIAGDNPTFCEVVGMLSGKTIDELNREIAANKKRIKDELNVIPIRINEQQRNLIEDKNWSEIESRISKLRYEMNALQDENEILRVKNEAVINEKQSLYNEISAKNREISSIKLEIEKEAMKDYNEKAIEFEKKKSSAYSLNAKKMVLTRTIEDMQKELAELKRKKEYLLLDYNNINNRKLEIDEHAFACPTCGRLFDPDKIEEIEESMTENFNECKAEALEKNVKEGLAIKEKIEQAESRIQTLNSEISEIDKQLIAIGDVSVFSEKAPDVNTLIDNDDRIKLILSEIDDLKQKIESIGNVITNGSNMSEIAEKQAEIERLTTTLAMRSQKKAQEERIDELMNQQSELAVKLSDIERIEMKVLDFNKERVRFIESKINGLFKMVRFKLFDTLLNGTTVECCEATVDGIPFSTRSYSEKINMGLDIINAICTKKEVSAPIFIDNSESITDYAVVPQSQIISLFVNKYCENELPEIGLPF